MKHDWQTGQGLRYHHANGAATLPASRQAVLELEGDEDSALDTAGDAGVFGRWLVYHRVGYRVLSLDRLHRAR